MANQEHRRGGERRMVRFGRVLKTLLALLLCAVLLGQGMPTQTAVAEKDCMVTVSFSKVPADVGTSGTKVALYRIGTESGGKFAIDEYYVKNGGDFLHLTGSQTVEDAMENIEKAPLRASDKVQESTLSGDQIVFTGLDSGIYYGKKIDGPSEFGMEPFFVTLPVASEVVVNPKWQMVTKAKVVKVWKDADNQDGVRPTSIDVTLYVKNAGSNDAAKAYKDVKLTLNAQNQWTGEVENLPKVVGEAVQEYSFQEAEVKPYTLENATVEEDKDNNVWVTTLTNSYTPEETKVSVKKVWDDADNQDGKRPEKISVTLLADGKETSNVVELSEKNGWTAEVDKLPKYAAGKLIDYAWSEDLPDDPDIDEDDYSLVNTEGPVNGLITLTNKHTPGTTSATVKKIWNDVSNAEKKRPDTITVKLTNNLGKTVATVTLPENGKWEHTEENLPKYQDGQALTYTWSEVKVDGYTTQTSVSGNITTITNTFVPKTEVSVEKIWDDADNQDGIRPGSITVKLAPVGTEYTLSEANQWKTTVSNLDKYDESEKLIEYVWTEVKPEKLEGYVLGTPTREKDSTVTTITNSHTPKTTDVTVLKVWDDADNQDGKRPESITVQLKADGENCGEAVTLTEADKWTHTWKDLPVYKAGKEIVYTIDEAEVAGYSATVKKAEDNKYSFTITNSYTPGETTFTVYKVWDDANDQDGIRPKSVTVQLYADEKAYGEPVTLTPDKDGKWEYTWEKLPLMAEGKKIVYSVDETVEPDDYAKSVDGAYITNTHEPETIKIPVEKKWEDNDDQDGIRPESVTVNLLADGAPVKSAVLNATNQWKAEWTDLPKFKDHGTEIVYTVTEETVKGYDAPVITGDKEKGFTVTNPHTPEETEITVKKEWDDKDNQDGVRPKSITVQLLADNKKVEEATLTAENDWTYTWEKLPKKAGGKDIVYTVSEVSVESYQAEVNGLTITNRHTPGKTSIEVRKVWDDANDQDGIRPASVTVQLYANGEKLGNAEALNESNHWKYTWNDLDVNKDGKAIDYTVEETVVPEGYDEPIITGNAAEGYTITNPHTPEVIKISVTKVWNDGEDQDKLRPQSIQVRLLKDGEAYGDTVTLNAANSWAYTWEKLPKNSAKDKLAVYTVEEVSVPTGYTVSYAGGNSTNLIITNTHTPSVGSLIIRKRVTVNNAAPTAAQLPQVQGTYTFRLTDESGKAIQREVNGQMRDWEISITNNASNEVRINNLKPGKYTIRETNLPAGMTQTSPNGAITVEVLGNNTANIPVAEFVNNRNVENPPPPPEPTPEPTPTPTPEETAEPTPTPTPTPMTHIDGRKIWDDQSNLHRVRPTSVTVQLYANGSLVSSNPTWLNTSGDSWSYDFGDFPAVDAAGRTINYTVREQPLTDYTATVSGMTITNHLIPRTPREYTRYSGVKTWLDNNNADGARPNYITVQLLQDGRVYQERTVTAASDWQYSFENVPVDDGYGYTFTYTIRELAVPGYYMRTDGTNFTNGYIPPVPENPPTQRTVVPPLQTQTEEELEELFDLFDYGTPLFGMQTTGDEIPVYPFIFGGIGLMAILAFLVLGKKNRSGEVRK